MATPLNRTEKILSDAFTYTLNSEGRWYLKTKLDTLVKRKILQDKSLIKDNSDINLSRLTDCQKIFLLRLINESTFGGSIKKALEVNFKSGINPKVYDDGVKIIYKFASIINSSERLKNIESSSLNRVFEQITKWAFEPNGSNHLELESLSYALRYDLDLDTILSICSGDESIRESSRQIIDIFREKEQFRERNLFAVKGLAALTMLGLLSFSAIGSFNLSNETIKSVEDIIEPITNNQLNVKLILTTFISTYLGTKFISKGTDWTSTIYSSLCNSLNINYLSKNFPERVSKRLIHCQLYNGFGYDVTNIENKKSLFISCFLAQKALKPELEVSSSLMDNFSVILPPKEIEILNKITLEQINEVSNLRSPHYIETLLFDNLSFKQKCLIKEIDIWTHIANKGVYGDKKYYNKGTFFSDYTQITTIDDYANHPLVEKLLIIDNILDQYNGIEIIKSRLLDQSIPVKEVDNLNSSYNFYNENILKIKNNSFLKDKEINFAQLSFYKKIISEVMISYTSGTKALTTDFLDTLNSHLESGKLEDKINSFIIKSTKGTVQKTKQIKTWGVLSKITAVIKSDDSLNNVNPNVRDFLHESCSKCGFENVVKICEMKGSGLSNPIYKVSDTLFKLRAKNKTK